MGLNAATFLKRLEGIVTGNGFKKSIDVTDMLKTSAGLILTASTHPGKAALETNLYGIQAVAGQTALGSLLLQVPRDYDKSIDKMYFRFLANSVGDTDTPTIDAAIYQKKSMTALSADLNPTISTAVNNNTTKAGWVEIKVEGKGLEPGASLFVVFTSGAHGTDVLNIYAVEMVYYSDLVYYESSER